MQKLVLFIFLLPMLFSKPLTPSQAFDEIINNFQGNLTDIISLNYTHYVVHFHKIRFLYPILTNTTKEEVETSIKVSNILITMIATITYGINDLKISFLNADILIEFPIDLLVLTMNEEKTQIILSELTLSSYYIDNYLDIMSIRLFKDFQNDKEKQIINSLTEIVSHRINEELITINSGD